MSHVYLLTVSTYSQSDINLQGLLGKAKPPGEHTVPESGNIRAIADKHRIDIAFN